MSMMRDVAIVSFAQAPLDQPPGMSETTMLLPTITEALATRRADAPRRRLHVLGQRRLPDRRHVHVRADARSRGRVAADLRVARRDGRRVGAVRGVGAAAARRHRRRARVRVGPRRPRACRCARRSTLQLDPYYLVPLGADYVSLSALQAQAVLAATGTHRARPRRDRRAVAARREGQPERGGVGRLHRRRSARQGLRRRAAARARHRPAGRRCGRGRARRGRPGARPRASGRRGSRASTTAPIRTTRACATSSTSPSTAIAAERGGRRPRRRRGRGAHRGVLARGAACSPTRWASATTSRSIRRAVRSSATRRW